MFNRGNYAGSADEYASALEDLTEGMTGGAKVCRILTDLTFGTVPTHLVFVQPRFLEENSHPHCQRGLKMGFRRRRFLMVALPPNFLPESGHRSVIRRVPPIFLLYRVP